MSVRQLESFAALTSLIELCEQFDQMEGLPILYGETDPSKSADVLPADHPFVELLMSLIATPQVEQLLESLTDRFSAEGRLSKPQEVNLVVLNTGESKDSSYVSTDKERIKRVIYLTVGSWYYVRKVLSESLGGKKLKKGHIMGVFLHEYFHPFKFSGHPEEYNADRAAIIAMIELGYDPEDFIEALQAHELMIRKREAGFAPSHPFTHSRIARMQATIDEVYAARPHLLENILEDQDIPEEVLENLFNDEERGRKLEQQRKLFTSNSSELIQRMNEASSFADFWEAYLAYDVRINVEVAQQRYDTPTSAYYHLSKLVLVGRALKFYYRLQEKKSEYIARGEELPETLLAEVMAEGHGDQLNASSYGSWDIHQPEAVITNKDGQLFRDVVAYTQPDLPSQHTYPFASKEADIVELRLNYLSDILRSLYGKYMERDEYQEGSYPDRQYILDQLTTWLKAYSKRRWPQQRKYSTTTDESKTPTQMIDYSLTSHFADQSDEGGFQSLAEFQQLLFWAVTETVRHLLATVESDEERKMYSLLLTHIEELHQEATTETYNQDLLSEEVYDWSLPEIGGQLAQQLQLARFAQQRARGVGSKVAPEPRPFLSGEDYVDAHRAIGVTVGMLETRRLETLLPFVDHAAFLLRQREDLAFLSQELVAAWLSAVLTHDWLAVERIAETEMKADPEYARKIITLLDKFKNKVYLPNHIETNLENFSPENGGDWLGARMKDEHATSEGRDGHFSTSNRRFKSACLNAYFRAFLPDGVLVFEDDGRIKSTESHWHIRESEESMALLYPIREVLADDWEWHYLHGTLEERSYEDPELFADLMKQLKAGDIDSPDPQLVAELKKTVKACDISYPRRSTLKLSLKEYGILLRAGVVELDFTGNGDLSLNILFEHRAGWGQYDNRSKPMQRMMADVLRARYRKYQVAVVEDDEKHWKSYHTAHLYEKDFWWFAKYFCTNYSFQESAEKWRGTERVDTPIELDGFLDFVLANNIPVPKADWMGKPLVHSALITRSEKLLEFIRLAEERGLFMETAHDPYGGVERRVSPLPMRTQDRLSVYAYATRNNWLGQKGNESFFQEHLSSATHKWHKDDNARVILLNLILGGNGDQIAEMYAPLKRQVDFKDYATAKQYIRAMDKGWERKKKLEKNIPIWQQQQIAERFNGLRRVADFKQMIQLVQENFPVPGPLQDELFAYCWALYDHFADHRHKSEMREASEYLLSLFTGEDWKTIGRSSTEVDTLSYYMSEESRTPDYLEHTIGYKFFAQEIYETVGTRRYAYESALEYPFFVGSAGSRDTEESDFSKGISVGFTEYFIARRLLDIDTELAELTATNFRAAIARVREVSRGIETAVVTIYIEYIIRHALQRDDLVKEDAEYLYQEFLLFPESAAKNSHLDAPLLRKRIDTDAQFFTDYASALQVILQYLPEGSFERNEFMAELQTRCTVTPAEVAVIESYIVDESGIQKDQERERHKVTLFDVIGDLAVDQKGQLLFYLIDENSPKPTGKIFVEYERKANADLSNLRTSFLMATVAERKQVIQRLVYGPEATLSLPHSADGDVFHPSVSNDERVDRQSFAENLATLFIKDSDRHTPETTARYREILSAALVSMEPLKASTVISNIVNKMIELDRMGQRLAVEDMLYIAVLSFGSVGIKSAQLVADYPWVPTELKEVFKQGLWNAELVRPAELQKVFEYEKNQLGNFVDFEITRYLRPLGSAGICQAYLVEVAQTRPDGQKVLRELVIKVVKPGVIGMRQIAHDVRDLQRFLTEMKRRGHQMDIPVDLTDVITTIILEERSKQREAQYFSEYESSNDQRTVTFDTPEVIATGQYMIMVEFVEGKVLADAGHDDQEIMQLLFGAFQDLQIGLLNLDDHLGNFIRQPDGTEKQLASIDGGFTLDLRQQPELHQVIVQLVRGLLSGDEKSLRGALLALGIEADVPNLAGMELAQKIEQFRQVFFRSPKGEHTVLVHKLLWWMYRKLSLYHSASPFMQQFMAKTLSG
ncbi:hypothetical protein H3C66_01610 [Patescibacteria group bacterium]|nr:hypothetical protein [Patescibacteria group bacterium]